MRVKFSYLPAGILGLMLAVSFQAAAQDDIPVPGPSSSNIQYTHDPGNEDEKSSLTEQEIKGTKAVDSLQLAKPTVPAKPKANDKKAPQAEGDPLNFNFLYYIIQKFKASELMME